MNRIAVHPKKKHLDDRPLPTFSPHTLMNSIKTQNNVTQLLAGILTPLYDQRWDQVVKSWDFFFLHLGNQLSKNDCLLFILCYTRRRVPPVIHVVCFSHTKTRNADLKEALKFRFQRDTQNVYCVTRTQTSQWS